jgi:Protein of unknown function (DUF1616)
MSRSRGRRIVPYPDLLLIALIGIAAVVAVVLNLPVVLRLVLALPLVFFVPGYALVSALFPARPLPALERLLISVGASFAITILAGLVVARVFGLSATSWTVTLALFGVVGAGLAWLRRTRSSDTRPTLQLPAISTRDALPVAVAALAAIAIVVGTRMIAAQQEAPPPAQLWLVPVADGSFDARLGVRAGPAGGTYAVQLTSAGVAVEQFDISLAPGETWETVVDLTAEERQRPIVGRLYEGGSELELRFVVLQPPVDAG